jgi:glycosyltransferase involved in cell wall biosynthesis
MSAQKPLVTIAIPTYNRAGTTLGATIESALSQTYENIEIIVSDNCSGDNTSQMLDSYGNKIRSLRQKVNLGSNGNYNALLQAAKGTYFLLLHDDDLIDPDLVQACMAAADYGTQFGLIRTGTRMIDAAGNYIKEPRNSVKDNRASSLYEAWLTGASAFYLCSTLFNTQALREIGGLKSKNNLFEDGIAIITISQNWPIINLKETKASFRMHADQQTHAAFVGKWCEDFRQAIDLICSYEDENRYAFYLQGMHNFSRVGLLFCKKVDSPFKRTKAMVEMNKYFPAKYWPRKSWKTNIIGFIAGLIRPEKRTEHLKPY